MTIIMEQSSAIKVSISKSLLNIFKDDKPGIKTASSAIITETANKEKNIAMSGLR